MSVGVISAQHKIGLNIGNKAPSLVGSNPSGKIMKLSDIKNKVVLIDFWASWCGPCRRENPVVVKAYKKFKNEKLGKAKGFTVFSISLDKNTNSWQRAISSDKLEWPYHISDLKGWSSKYAMIYHVRSIPTNFLIDENGIIIAKGLRGPALEAKLKSLKK